MTADGSLSVLIIGGAGTFGRRLVGLLEHDARLKLIVAGRSLERAQAICARPGNALLVAERFDRDGDPLPQMQRLRPDLVIDAAGPFQLYGDDPYRIVKAALAVGCHYLDLADGRAFVRGIARFDDEARAACRFVLSGVSTFPVLSGAVIRALSADMDEIGTLEAGVAPSPRADLGLNVIRAIVSYAGRPVRPAGRGLTDARYRTIAVPGTVPLPHMAFSLVDVPDPPLLMARWPGLASAWFGVGTRPQIFHFMLVLAAWLVRLRLLPGLLWLAGPMHFVSRTFTWGDHRSGMFVNISGRRHGMPVKRSWTLIANGDDGLNIPVMAAAAAVLRLADGDPMPGGARPADLDFTLGDYQSGFDRLDIRTAIQDGDASGETLPLYRRLLGETFATFSPAIRKTHELDGRIDLAGEADVSRGRNFLSRLIAAMIGFPAEGKAIPLQVTLSGTPELELWQRNFNGRKFRSTQFAGRGRDQGLLMERFGLLTFGLGLVRDGDRLRLVAHNWNLFGLPLPRFLMPKIDAYEHAADGRFNFHVRISVPLAGFIVGYQGWLEPAEEVQAQSDAPADHRLTSA